MEIQLTHGTSSPSSSTSSPNPNPNPNPNLNPIHSWWEAISKARSRIQSLSSILSSPSSSSSSISSLAESDRPARSLLESQDAYYAISAALSPPHSGSGEDPLCQWLYETYQSSDQDLRLVVISFIPLLAGLYLSRIVSSQMPNPSLSGFEAVLLSLFAAETRSRAGKPVLISVPDLSQPSLYHSPRTKTTGSQSQPSIGVLSAPLEPQIAVKSTKRACIVAVALDQYFKSISLMPSCSKLDFCEFAAAWAGQNCSCKNEFDGDGEELEIVKILEVEDGIGHVSDEMGNLGIGESSNGQCTEARVSRGARIPLPWELLQPMLRILGHCLLAPLNLPEVRDSASVAVRCLYARASHDLVPQAILATRSLIQLDKRARVAAKAAAAANAASNANTPSKPKKPEILLVSK